MSTLIEKKKLEENTDSGRRKSAFSLSAPDDLKYSEVFKLMIMYKDCCRLKLFRLVWKKEWQLLPLKINVS